MDERKMEDAPGIGFAALMATIAFALILGAASVGKYLADVSETSAKMASTPAPAAPAASVTPTPEPTPATPPASEQPPPTTTPAP